MSDNKPKKKDEVSISLVEANGTKLYTEKRGSGPLVVFVPGATGDSSHFQAVAKILSDEFTTLVYDRRGNSRSPRPKGWKTTSIDEQSDDLAALIKAVGPGPAFIVGNSLGAIIVGDLLLRDPKVARGAVLHEPPLFWISPEYTPAVDEIGRRIGEGIAAGGPAAALDRFFEFALGKRGFESIPPEDYKRLREGADTFFSIELPYTSWEPKPADLKKVKVPSIALAGVEDPKALGRAYLIGSSKWIAEAIGAPYRDVVGGHAPYFSDPKEFSEELRKIFHDWLKAEKH